MVEFPKISIKMKNCKTSDEGPTAIRVNEIIQPLHHPSLQQDKILLHLLHGDIQKYTDSCFKVLQECSSQASRNAAGQMFFLTPNRKILAGECIK